METAARRVRGRFNTWYEAAYVSGPAVAGFAASTLYAVWKDTAAAKEALIWPAVLFLFGCVLLITGLLKH